jgi:two-component system chemotaxis response regulator CheY
MPTEPRAITVLVVDDEDDIRALVRVLLEHSGMQVIEQALDGLDALITVARLAPPPLPTVIVLDNMMPVLSGLEVASQILQQIPEQIMVLFSAHLTPAIIHEARELGIAACVAKTDVAQLPGIIEGLVSDDDGFLQDNTPPVADLDLREASADRTRWST